MACILPGIVLRFADHFAFKFACPRDTTLFTRASEKWSTLFAVFFIFVIYYIFYLPYLLERRTNGRKNGRLYLLMFDLIYWRASNKWSTLFTNGRTNGRPCLLMVDKWSILYTNGRQMVNLIY